MGKPSIVDSEKYRVSAHLPESLLVWGTLTELGDQILTVAAPETLTVAVRLDRDVSAGYSIEFWTHFVSDIQRPQMDAPNGPAHFSCDSPVEAVPFVHPDAKVHGPGSFFPYRRYAGVRLQEPAPAGTEFVFRVADVSMQTYEETLFNLRFAILEGDRVMGYLGDAYYVVRGAGRHHLWITAPTRVTTGEPFDAKIVVLDRWGNKTGDPLEALAFELTVDGDNVAVEGGEVVFDPKWQQHVVRGLRVNDESVVYLRARLRDDAAVNGLSNPIVVKDTWDGRIYWGDMHQHGYYHDGRGTPAANYEYAISTSCLDFLTVAPHEEATFNPPSIHMAGAPPQTGWEEMQAAAAAYDGDEIVAILGSEASSLGRVAAHMNAYYLDLDNRPEFERMGLFYRSGENIDLTKEDPAAFYASYLAELERSTGEFLLLPHAHACGGPGKFDLPKRPEYQTNIEICSVHGVFEEFYRQWLKHGHFVGVHGSGDNHMTSTGNGNPGYHYPNTNGLAAVVATERTRKGVFDAFRQRRTYAVTGNQRIYLDFSVNDAAMGNIVVNGASTRTLHLDVAGTAPVMRVELLKNNEVIRCFEPVLARHDTLRLAWTDSWGSRRVDDSLTTGTLSLDGGALSVVDRLHMYHRTDRIEATSDNDEVVFRTNGYSGITRGVVMKVTSESPEAATLHFGIHDEHLGDLLLDEVLDIPLRERRSVHVRPLGDRVLRPCFTNEPYHPEFTLEVDWVDPSWAKVLSLDWEDDDGAPAFYYVRVEQIDGNIAWSSPVWFVTESPFGS